MPEPSQNTTKYCFWGQNYTLKLLFAFEMAYFCCFTIGGNLDLLQKSFITSTTELRDINSCVPATLANYRNFGTYLKDALITGQVIRKLDLEVKKSRLPAQHWVVGATVGRFKIASAKKDDVISKFKFNMVEDT